MTSLCNIIWHVKAFSCLEARSNMIWNSRLIWYALRENEMTYPFNTCLKIQERQWNILILYKKLIVTFTPQVCFLNFMCKILFGILWKCNDACFTWMATFIYPPKRLSFNNKVVHCIFIFIMYILKSSSTEVIYRVYLEAVITRHNTSIIQK